VGAGGNSIPYFKSIPIVKMNEQGETVEEIQSDCPMLTIWFEGDQFKLQCWDWVPGPGPGDFVLGFDDEETLMEFVDSYYFGDNEYFNQKERYALQSRDTINIKDIKSIFAKLMDKLEREFSQGEIEFGERGLFHKIPYDTWRIDKFQGENPTIEVNTGFLKNEIYQLRKKVDENQDFDFGDVNNVSDLLFELSLLLKSKNNPL
jgi:hypothetical protein